MMIDNALVVSAIKGSLSDQVLVMQIIDTMTARVCGTVLGIVFIIMAAATVITGMKVYNNSGIK